MACAVRGWRFGHHCAWSDEDSATPCLVRYFDLNLGKGRDVGRLPFCAGELHENGAEGADWSFALSGRLPDGQPAILVGSAQAIPGLIANATLLAFDGDALRYRKGAGEEETAKTNVLLGTALGAIYTPSPSPEAAAPKLLQVSPDGTSLQVMQNNDIRRGTWHTDGFSLALTSGSSTYTILSFICKP